MPRRKENRRDFEKQVFAMTSAPFHVEVKGIRVRTKTWNKHTNRVIASWSFYQLQQYVDEYKAYYFGLKFEQVNPAYTSQTCSLCGKQGNRKGARLTCAACGEKEADYYAACVIAAGEGARKPPRISGKSAS